MEKKGQAAMEFLMTYGWAILAAIIAIGVLAYFGVFSPGKYMPDACTINAPLGCDDHKVNTTGVYLIIRNGAGDTINMTSASVAGCTVPPASVGLADGAISTLEFTGCSGLTTGAKFKADVSITYTTSTGTFPKTTSGTLVSQVTAA
jgi:hypothetical protein